MHRLPFRQKREALRRLLRRSDREHQHHIVVETLRRLGERLPDRHVSIGRASAAKRTKGMGASVAAGLPSPDTFATIGEGVCGVDLSWGSWPDRF